MFNSFGYRPGSGLPKSRAFVEQFYKQLSLHAASTSKTVVHGSLDRRGTRLVRQALLIMENRARIGGHSDEAIFHLPCGTLSSSGSQDEYHHRQN